MKNARRSSYQTILIEPHRPPSKGGNTRAWHSHVLVVDGVRYSFLAIGARRWVYAGDTVSFEWKWDATKKYRNIRSDSIKVRDKNGAVIERGLRGDKPIRTAEARMPVSRREMRD